MLNLKTLATATFLAATAAGAIVSDALAQSRPSTLGMSCGQAQAFVRSRGAVVMTTGPHTFDRFVATRQFCTPDEELEPTWARTRDAAQCMVGYRCEPRRSWRFDR